MLGRGLDLSLFHGSERDCSGEFWLWLPPGRGLGVLNSCLGLLLLDVGGRGLGLLLRRGLGYSGRFPRAISSFRVVVLTLRSAVSLWIGTVAVFFPVLGSTVEVSKPRHQGNAHPLVRTLMGCREPGCEIAAVSA